MSSDESGGDLEVMEYLENDERDDKR
ncbi:unnamed protein product, partial [Brachionus calyciflorus]